MPSFVRVWERGWHSGGFVIIDGTVYQDIIDNIVGENVEILGSGLYVKHDRTTVLNKLQQLGYRQILSAVPGERARSDWKDWTFWTLEK